MTSTVTSIKNLNNIYGYCKAHGLSRYMMHLMLRFAKYRISNRYGIFQGVSCACKTNRIIDSFYMGMISDLVESLVATRSNPKEFEKILHAVKCENEGFEAVLIQLMAEWHLYLVLDAVRTYSRNSEKFNLEEVAKIGATLREKLFLHAEHVVLVFANNQALLENTNAYKPSELYAAQNEMMSWLSHNENITYINNIFGGQVIAKIFESLYSNMEMIKIAVDASNHPDDYDLNA